jgi:DNA-binding MarR family transcriptional regulator
VRKPPGADTLAEVRDSLRIPKKILKAHVSSLEHGLVERERHLNGMDLL